MTSIRTFPGPIEERSLADLIDSVTSGVIRPVVRRNLHVSLRDDDTTSDNQNALDLVGDIQVALLCALESGRSNGRPIENLDAYAATIATNACYQYLRAKFPVRAQQMNKLRYLLTHDDRFKTFRVDEVWHCELTGKDAHGRRHEGHSRNLERENYAQAVITILRGRTLVRIDELVGEVMSALGIHERRSLGTDDPFEHIADTGIRADVGLESHDRLARLWTGVLELPLNHRKALLLNLRDSAGGLIWALPASGVASVAEIAYSLEMTPDQLARIWDTLPWDDRKIAEHLGLQRQQVINLRQSARAKLMRYEAE